MLVLARYFPACAITSVAAVSIVPVATVLTALEVPAGASHSPGPA